MVGAQKRLASGEVNQKTIGRIRGDDGRIPTSPVRNRTQSKCIGLGSVRHQATGPDRERGLRLPHRQTGTNTGMECMFAAGHDDALLADGADDEDE
jgi:hypothetical protein